MSEQPAAAKNNQVAVKQHGKRRDPDNGRRVDPSNAELPQSAEDEQEEERKIEHDRSDGPRSVATEGHRTCNVQERMRAFEDPELEGYERSPSSRR